MEDILLGPVLAVNNSAEAKYVRALALQKQTQKNATAHAKKAQLKVAKYAAQYGEELLRVIMSERGIMRIYARGGKYILEFITASGQITIYSHPLNPATKPKLEVHHRAHGFITCWVENELLKYETTAHSLEIRAPLSVTPLDVYRGLCARAGFEPTDTRVVIAEQNRTAAMMIQ